MRLYFASPFATQNLITSFPLLEFPIDILHLPHIFCCSRKVVNFVYMPLQAIKFPVEWTPARNVKVDSCEGRCCSKDSKSKNYNMRLISVPGGGVSKAVYFPIVPTQIGEVKLSVVAQSAKAGDAIEQPLKVEACYTSYFFVSPSHWANICSVSYFLVNANLITTLMQVFAKVLPALSASSA